MMVNHNIKGTGVGVTPELRDYAAKRLSQVEKFIGGDSTAHTDIEFEYSQVRDGDKYRAEFTLSVGGNVHRAEAWGATLHEAIDSATNILEKELRRTKRKNIHLLRRGGALIKDAIRGLRERF